MRDVFIRNQRIALDASRDGGTEALRQGASSVQGGTPAHAAHYCWRDSDERGGRVVGESHSARALAAL